MNLSASDRQRRQPRCAPHSVQLAFSLIEILVILAVIGALAGIAIPSYREYRERALIARTISEIAMIANALERYRLDYHGYPANLAMLPVAVPPDPWGNAYGYLPIDFDPAPRVGEIRKDRNLHPLNSDFDLYSNGPDGRTQKQLTARWARDDIVRADNGRFIDVAYKH